MNKHGLAGRLKKSLLTGILAGYMGLLGCGGGGSSVAPTPPPQGLSQTVSLFNHVDIDYRATLTNVSQATRTITHNNTQISTTNITTSPYAETLNDRAKGNYRFDLTSGNLSDTDLLTIPNYSPASNFSSLETNLNQRYEGSSKTFNLETLLSDRNPEDRPVPLTGANSLDGKTQVSVSGSNLTITATGVPGHYQVEVDFGSDAGGRGRGVITGEILPVPEQIAFWSMRVRPGEGCFFDLCEDIYAINDDRTGEKRLTTHPRQDLAPVYSPDGSKIAFVSNRDGPISIYTMNADGTNQTRLTNNLSFAHWPDWCSNGKIVFRFENHPTLGLGIASINPDGTGFEKLIDGATAESHPSCSPDSSKIAFETFRDGNFEVYVKDLAAGIETNLTNNLAVDGQPAWSPDGSKILFFSDRDTPEFDLYSINPDGTGLQRLTIPGREVDPSYSPDGSKIALAHDIATFFNPRVHIMNADGTGFRELVTFTSRYPAWRP